MKKVKVPINEDMYEVFGLTGPKYTEMISLTINDLKKIAKIMQGKIKK